VGEQKKFIKWIKEHKKALIIAGVSVATLITIVWGIKNKELIKDVWISLKKIIEKPDTRLLDKTIDASTTNVICPVVEKALPVAVPSHDMLPFKVNRHIRNLPEGMNASPEKIEEARKLHIVLKENQTLVKPYVKRATAA
jgi:hypothetical protein